MTRETKELLDDAGEEEERNESTWDWCVIKALFWRDPSLKDIQNEGSTMFNHVQPTQLWDVMWISE